MLLRAIADHGSVSAAASDIGRSRSRALTRLESLESVFGPLVERRRGGSDGGGSRLTDEAHALLARFDRLRAALSSTAAVDETVFEGTVTERTGELGLVETPAGTLRALLDDDDATVESTVQVSVRADAVTLHAPEEAPSKGATSARNRFSGTVTFLDRGEAVVRVLLDVGSAAPLTALVTVESVDRLSLALDDSVVASFKATATRATSTRTPSD